MLVCLIVGEVWLPVQYRRVGRKEDNGRLCAVVQIEYDILIVSVGSVNNTFGIKVQPMPAPTNTSCPATLVQCADLLWVTCRAWRSMLSSSRSAPGVAPTTWQTDCHWHVLRFSWISTAHGVADAWLLTAGHSRCCEATPSGAKLQDVIGGIGCFTAQACTRLSKLSECLHATAAQVSECFERAALPLTAREERQKLLSFVICGGCVPCRDSARTISTVFDNFQECTRH